MKSKSSFRWSYGEINNYTVNQITCKHLRIVMTWYYRNQSGTYIHNHRWIYKNFPAIRGEASEKSSFQRNLVQKQIVQLSNLVHLSLFWNKNSFALYVVCAEQWCNLYIFYTLKLLHITFVRTLVMFRIQNFIKTDHINRTCNYWVHCWILNLLLKKEREINDLS